MPNIEPISERLRQVRHSVKLPQRKFSARVAISPNYLAEMELSKKPVNERVIKLVSMEFGVDEHWLRTGEGTMLKDDADARIAKVVTLFKAMNPQFQACALKQLMELEELHSLLK